MAELCGNLAARKPSTIVGTGEQTRDYMYVDDVARANVLALEEDPPPGAYNIGTGIETSVNGLYELLQDIFGMDLPPRNCPGKLGEQLRSCVDPSRAGRVFGWRPEVSLADRLRETLRFFGAR